MAKNIAEICNFAPRDLRCFGLCFLGYMTTRFRNNFQIADNRIVNERIGPENLERLAGKKRVDLLNGFRNIQQSFPDASLRH